MELASVAGLILALGALAAAQVLEGGTIEALLNPTAALVVFGGTLAAALLGSVPMDLRRGLALLPRAFAGQRADDARVAVRLMELAGIARRRGVVALDGHAALRTHPALEPAIQRIVDGVACEDLREILETDLDVRTERDLAAVRVFEAAGGVAPTLGILGAVLGLIQALQHMEDPAALGRGISHAFIATLYGVGGANLLFLPVAAKLRRRIDEDRLSHQIVIEGSLVIREGHGPAAVRERLAAFLRPGDRAILAHASRSIDAARPV